MLFVNSFLSTSWALFQELWYWAIIGVVLAQVVSRFVTTQTIQRRLTGESLSSIGLAAGAALPLCACGVIPFLVSFLRIGVPIAVVMAFTAASPLMDPVDFLLTSGILGIHWAVIKTLAALAMGLGLGLLIRSQNRRGAWLDQLKVRADVRADVPPDDSTSTGVHTLWRTGLKFLSDLWFSGKFLLLAIVLGALLNTVVPASFVGRILGGQHWYGVPLAAMLGMTTYGISSAPFVKILLHMGMSPGAGMAFLISGHATSIGLLTTLATLVKRQIFLAFAGLTLVVSLLFGFAFNLFS